jgi:hypothetical protein
MYCKLQHANFFPNKNGEQKFDFVHKSHPMTSMEVSLTIPTYVEYENALVFGSRHLVRTYPKYESEFFRSRRNGLSS